MGKTSILAGALPPAPEKRDVFGLRAEAGRRPEAKPESGRKQGRIVRAGAKPAKTKAVFPRLADPSRNAIEPSRESPSWSELPRDHQSVVKSDLNRLGTRWGRGARSSDFWAKVWSGGRWVEGGGQAAKPGAEHGRPEVRLESGWCECAFLAQAQPRRNEKRSRSAKNGALTPPGLWPVSRDSP